jgi:hypothetical protein
MKSESFIIILFLIAQISFSQNEITQDKYCLPKVYIDNRFFNNFTYQYQQYIPGTQYQYFEFKDFDVTVLPNRMFFPTINTTQSELSIDVHPMNPEVLFAGANSTDWPVSKLMGTSGYWTENSGNTWKGFDNPPFGANQGDPVHIVGTDGYFYINYISSTGGQEISRSVDNGINWKTFTIAPNPGKIADKNHLMVDKKKGSPYENRLYAGWLDDGGNNHNDVVVVYSANFGQDWSNPVNLSKDHSAALDQGINIQTGPNGEVYATWAVYFDYEPITGEDAIGFAKSTDGGVTWSEPVYIYKANNFGIRYGLPYPCPLPIRVNSFPSMTVDRSGGVYNGNIYIVWTQSGIEPAGIDADIVLIRSEDGGTSWSSPVRINNDALNNGKQQFFPWCSVDQYSGRLNIAFYDNRNTTIDSTGLFIATSVDGGLTFENFQVSDANFHPEPIAGLAPVSRLSSGYQGDYIGIASAGNKAFPAWMDNRTGNYQAWFAEVQFGLTIIHSPYPNTENLKGLFAINATVASQNSLIQSEIKIFWGRGNRNISDSLVMTNSGGGLFNGNIPGDGNPHIYNYFIKAVDNQGKVSTAPSGAPGSFYTFEAAPDMSPPVIYHTPLSDQIMPRWPVSVSADVEDNLGIQSVLCEFKINNEPVSEFPMKSSSNKFYSGLFPDIPVSDGDFIEYRIKATDNSTLHNISYDPESGYNSFKIADAKGKILIVDDEINLDNTSNSFGSSATIFIDALTKANYMVTAKYFDSLDASTLNNYDVVILTAGLKHSAQFNDLAKRAAIGFYSLAGGKTIVEGGDVGFYYNAAPETDAFFRRNVLNDSLWVSDRIGDNLVFINPNHPVFNIPKKITGPVSFKNSAGTGGAARDEVTLVEKKPGVSLLARWSGSMFNGGIIIYSPNYDPEVCRNVFYTFSVSQLAEQNVTATLIENTVAYLMREVYPVGIKFQHQKHTTEIILLQNYPNPFKESTKIKYSISRYSQVQITIIDLLGNEIKTILNGEKQPGTYELTWNAANLPDGIYFCQLKADGYIQTKKMVLMK